MQTVVETPTFTRQTRKLFTEDERHELIDLLATNPLAGDVMPGTGGVRKLRFRTAGSGKRGGGRVVYYFLVFRHIQICACSCEGFLVPGEARRRRVAGTTQGGATKSRGQKDPQIPVDLGVTEH